MQGFAMLYIVSKNLLFKRLGDYWLECSCADVTKEELTVYVLCDQPQAGVGT